MHVGRNIIVLVLLVFAAGCASNPIAEKLRDQAKPLTHTQVTANPKATHGDTVVWGGRIINTVNHANGSGEIYIMQLPLNHCGRPSDNNLAAKGRFIAVSSESFDPSAYPSGHLITLAGQIAGVRNERLGNLVYAYPVVDIKQVHLWASRRKDYYYYANYPGWYWGYSPVWWDGGVGWYYPKGYGILHAPNHGDQFRSGGGSR
ncbi:MAG TPA: Slp family lipoprotein [Verrucomicrobiae bacterium]|nr:Slp family lipoprotein [Verrucomicrobiae bacterium]